jgi:hypothetical protein
LGSNNSRTCWARSKRLEAAQSFWQKARFPRENGLGITRRLDEPSMSFVILTEIVVSALCHWPPSERMSRRNQCLCRGRIESKCIHINKWIIQSISPSICTRITCHWFHSDLQGWCNHQYVIKPPPCIHSRTSSYARAVESKCESGFFLLSFGSTFSSWVN